MKKLVGLLKFALPLAIIAWLVSMIEPQQRAELLARDKDWHVLFAAFAAIAAAVSCSFIRWYLLVRALGIPFRVRDAFRLGTLAYLLNFISVGSVGGDLFKAVFIAREQPGRRTEAVATVVVDRLVGLYALLLVTTAALITLRIPHPPPVLVAITNTTYLAAAGCTLGILVMLTPGFSRGPIAEFLEQLPWVGPTAARIIASVRIYRQRLGVMLAAVACGITIHVLLVVGIFFIAGALFPLTPSLGEHFLIVPLSNVAGSLPFTPAGLGSFEFAMDELYKLVPPDGPGDVVGVLVALTYRLTTLAVAFVGILYYWTCREEVRQVLKEAESVPAKQVDSDVQAVH